VPQLQGQKRRNKIYQNRVHLIGYVGKNPEAKTAKQSQRKYTVFSLATKRAWKGADEQWHSKTEFWRIVSDGGVWRPVRGFSLGRGHRLNLPVVTTKSIEAKAEESRAGSDQDSGL
jgi:Single-strand binding protein family